MSARKSILPVFIPHLGCPHACVYCNQSEITGQSSEKAAETLLKFCKNADGKAELAFYGGSFTAIPEQEQTGFLKNAKTALDSGRISGIRISTRPDAIDSVILDRLRRYGVTTIELGAQSMQDHVLQLCARGHTADDVRKASKLIREEGFQLVLQMMTGLPGDDDAGAIDTALQLIELRPDAVRIYPTVIVCGTELERMWRAGIYKEHSVEDAVRVCSQIVPLFTEAQIPIIRLGLNPTEELSSGAVLGGAYHPALGELVKSRVLRNQAELLMEQQGIFGQDAVIEVSDRMLSQMRGQKQCNVNWLKERFELHSLSIVTCSQAGVLRVFKSN